MGSESLTGSAQTVLGPVAASDLGIVLPHEHLLLDVRFLHRAPAPDPAPAITLANVYEVTYNWASNLDNLHLSDEAEAIEEVLAFRQAGGQTLVDATPAGIGRNPLGLQRIARATGLHVVMGAGYYVAAAHPPDMSRRSEDMLTREIIRDVTVGVDATGVRAGLIGEIGCSWPPVPAEQKALRGGARAARETGAPLMIHPGLSPEAPVGHLGEVQRAGLDPGRVIMAHVERTVFDPGGLKALAETGCYLEYDLFGVEVSHRPLGPPDMPSDAERMRQITWLIEQGHGRQVLLSHDVCFKIRLSRYGGPGYAHILRRIVPRLRARGLGDPEIRMLVATNPARALSFA